MTDLSLLEDKVQKKVVDFCKLLPLQVEEWSLILRNSEKPLQNLTHLTEQLKHVKAVKQTDLNYINNFSDIQKQLEYQICIGIEEETVEIQKLIDKLNQSCHNLRSKLLSLEESTLKLDWEADSSLIRGSALQPPLPKLLQHSLEFSTFFFNIVKNINENFKFLNINEESLNQLKQTFSNIDLNDKKVTYLVALTQYVKN